MTGVEERTLYDRIPNENLHTGGPGPRFVIARRERGMDEHDLWIGGDRDTGHYVCLQRGIFDELSVSSVTKVARDLNTLTQGMVDHYMVEHGISYGELTVALAQAKIAEMKIFEEHLLEEIRGLRETVSGYREGTLVKDNLKF